MSSIATHLRRVAVTALVATGAGLATTGTAQAAYSDCDPDKICIWEHAGGQGKIAEFATGVKNLAEWKGGVMNDKASSIYIPARHTSWCIYTNKNYGGTYYRFIDYLAPSNLSSSWNDKISSIRKPVRYTNPQGTFWYGC